MTTNLIAEAGLLADPSLSTAPIDGLIAPADAFGELARIAWRIGEEVAGPAADSVDRDSRFPSEAVAALREERLLSALVPVEYGGMGLGLGDVAGAVRALATHCASSALVLAMHSIEVFNIVRHGKTPAMRALLEQIASEQILLANANSEVGVGGDVSRSICAVEKRGDRSFIDKQALAISYGEYADAVVTIARRSPEAAETDQVQVICRKADLKLEATSTWNTMGLRGTCSNGFRLMAEVDDDAIFPVPFSVIANDGAIQAHQILLSAVWVGLAEAAAAKAHAYVRAAARRSIGSLPPAAVRLAQIAADLQVSRSLLVAATSQFEQLDAVGDAQNAGFMMVLRTLKVSTSEVAAAMATAALKVCGMAGFARQSPYSLDRILRDAHGGLVMVSNERLLTDNAQLLLARKGL